MDTYSLLPVILEQLDVMIITTRDEDIISYISPNSEQVVGDPPASVRMHESVENFLRYLNNGERIDRDRCSSPSSLVLNSVTGSGSKRSFWIKCSKADDTRRDVTIYTIRRLPWVATLITDELREDQGLDETRIEELIISYEERSQELQRCRIALSEVLGQLENRQSELFREIDVNIRELLLPIIQKMSTNASTTDSKYLQMMEQNLQQLMSPLGTTLSSIEFNLTPKEIELCNLVKSGFSIKEIASMQNLSERTIETHRSNIRKKLGIQSRKINLAAFLNQLH